ncbi:MAG TPA: DUF222 domain-containing protein [Jatrophihabitans sp.]|jgi:hypothetical protein
MDDVGGFSHGQLMLALVACERHRAALDARQTRIIAALSAERVAAHEKQHVRDEVASVLRLSPSVHGRFELAEGLARLPETMAALEDGEISVEHARVLTESLVGLDDETAALLEAAVLPYACTHDVYDTRRKAGRDPRKIDPLSAEQRLEQ